MTSFILRRYTFFNQKAEKQQCSVHYVFKTWKRVALSIYDCLKWGKEGRYRQNGERGNTSVNVRGYSNNSLDMIPWLELISFIFCVGRLQK